MATARRAAMLLAALLAGSGCGGAEVPVPTDEAVVRGWAADISRGDVEAATRRFALPSEIRDVSGRTRLVTRAAVRFFNETLPCGAEVVATRDLGPLLVARFRLRPRPGADCGSGTGTTTATAFEIRNGLIATWARLPATARDHERLP